MYIYIFIINSQHVSHGFPHGFLWDAPRWCELVVFTVESCTFFAHDGLAPPSWLRRAPLLLLGTLVKCRLAEVYNAFPTRWYPQDS